MIENAPSSEYLYFPLSSQAFDGNGAADVLEYETNTDFDILDPLNNELQFGLYHANNVWIVSDTLTRGGDTIGVVSAVAAVTGGFVAVVDIDTGLASPPAIGDSLTNGSTADTLTGVIGGVKVGGTSAGYWLNDSGGFTNWTPAGDHELKIPNAQAALFSLLGLQTAGKDMAMIWRQEYRTVGTQQNLLDCGAKASANSGGYRYQPNVTTDQLRCQIAYSELGGGTAGFLTGSKSIDNTSTPEVVFSSYYLSNKYPRVDIAQYDVTLPYIGTSLDTAQAYGAVDYPPSIPGLQTGHDVAIFGAINNDGTTYETGLGGGGNDYSIRSMWFIWPDSYKPHKIKNAAMYMAEHLGENNPPQLDGI